MSKYGAQTLRGRGSAGNPDNRYAAHTRETIDDGWDPADLAAPPLQTLLQAETCRSIISYNDSPDVPFDRSINPYRGCEHGCVYCFARPTHAYLDLSPGLDFESRLFYKPDAPALLRQELSRRSYRCAPLALGINTDAYQPVERRLQLTRTLIEVLADYAHPFSVITKSALIERDLDLLVPLAQRHLVHVAISLTTLDRHLARKLEPRASAPQRRLETVRRLRSAGIPVTVLIAPLIPVLSDHELETIMESAHEAGAVDVGYVLLRLPREVNELFQDWLARHAPLQADHVMSRLRECRAGKDNDSQFGRRMRGNGVFADLLRQRFRVAYRRLGFTDIAPLDCGQFRVPGQALQLGLF